MLTAALGAELTSAFSEVRRSEARYFESRPATEEAILSYKY